MKKNNKGFSLVELIIVIAIMAILAGALAPALIKYIAKSRRSTDVSNAQTIATAVTNALSVETAYDAVPSAGGSFDVSNNVKSSQVTAWTSFGVEVSSQLGSAVYKPKYDKDASFTVNIDSGKASFKVLVNGSELYPDVCSEYK